MKLEERKAATSTTRGACSIRTGAHCATASPTGRATTPPRPWGCSTPCSATASAASSTTSRKMRSAIRCAPRGGFRCDRHGVPRLPARCSGPARGPTPARPALGCGDPSLRASLSLRAAETLPRGRLPAVLRSRRRRPANGCIRWLPEVSTIPPCRAPSALAAGFRTLPRGRLRKPSAHVSQRRCRSVEER